jgi:glucose-1-phosphate cytidylyltransferase
MRLDENATVRAFEEKPQGEGGWINGGFFALEPSVLDRIEDDDVMFEHAPLEGLTADGQLVACRHEGFWQPMDTLRDKRHLDDLWAGGNAPWKVW